MEKLTLLEQIQNIPTLKETFLEELFKTMEEKKPLPDNALLAIKPGEQVIGEMNDFEIALRFIWNKYRVASELLSKKIIANNYIDLNNKELSFYFNRSIAANRLLWENIESRLADANTYAKPVWWEVRKGNKVVIFPKKEDHHDSLSQEILDEESNISSSIFFN
jgi:hypothetical protein